MPAEAEVAAIRNQEPFEEGEKRAAPPAGRLSAALLHVVHQPTAKGRDQSLAALVALICGPPPFGGVNTLREVAVRYGMSEQNLFLLMKADRGLLKKHDAPEYEI